MNKVGKYFATALVGVVAAMGLTAPAQAFTCSTGNPTSLGNKSYRFHVVTNQRTNGNLFWYKVTTFMGDHYKTYIYNNKPQATVQKSIYGKIVRIETKQSPRSGVSAHLGQTCRSIAFKH